ncbi:MAG: hypothetical protein P5700_25035, partial [Arthrospira platensis PCC 7345]|nr:hypothetical protein [Arthrospira platensis PCC 7345]
TNGRGFFYENEGVISGTISGLVRVVGINGLTLTAQMTLRYNNATTAISESFTVAGDEVTLEFAADEINVDGNAFIQLTADDLEFNFGGVITVGGNYTFTRSGQQFVATATEAYGGMSAGGVSLSVTDLELGLLINTGEEGGSYALYANGDAALTGLPGITASGSLSVWVNTTGEQEVDFGGAIGEIDYSTDADIYAFIGEDLTLSIADFVAISGSISFFTVEGEIVAVGQGIDASLTAAADVYARVEGADFGLVMGNGEFGFAVSGGSFALMMGPLANVTASEVRIRYTNDETFIAEGSEVGVNDITYTFDDQIESGVAAFEVFGLSVDLRGIANLAGDFAFALDNGELIAIGREIEASLGTAHISVGISDGEVGLLYRDDALAI